MAACPSLRQSLGLGLTTMKPQTVLDAFEKSVHKHAEHTIAALEASHYHDDNEGAQSEWYIAARYAIKAERFKKRLERLLANPHTKAPDNGNE